MSVLTDTQAALPTGTWNLDPVHSSIGFEIPYLAGTFRGQFADVEAKVTEEGLTGSARVASIDVKDENFSAHLQSPDFFDAERHPELTFESREFERSAEALTVRGDITIRGVTGPVELTGTMPTASGSGSRSRRPSTEPSSGSTGTRRFRAVSLLCRTT